MGLVLRFLEVDAECIVWWFIRVSSGKVREYFRGTTTGIPCCSGTKEEISKCCYIMGGSSNSKVIFNIGSFSAILAPLCELTSVESFVLFFKAWPFCIVVCTPPRGLAFLL